MIKQVSLNGNVLKFTSSRKFENALFALKTVLNDMEEVDIAGISFEHHLLEKCDFFLRVKKGDPMKILTQGIALTKERLEKSKLKE